VATGVAGSWSPELQMTQLPPNWVMPTCARASKVKYIQTEAEQSRESKTTIHIETAVSREILALYHRLPRSALKDQVWTAHYRLKSHIMHLRLYANVSGIHRYHVTAYHSIMSQTYDDALLDDGTFLRAILQATPGVREKALAMSMMELVAYLFTPAASRRSPMTAARAIRDYEPSASGKLDIASTSCDNNLKVGTVRIKIEY
jgi:hypothetical protein